MYLAFEIKTFYSQLVVLEINTILTRQYVSTTLTKLHTMPISKGKELQKDKELPEEKGSPSSNITRMYVCGSK